MVSISLCCGINIQWYFLGNAQLCSIIPNPRTLLESSSFHLTAQIYAQCSCNILHLCSHCVSYVRSKHVLSTLESPSEKRRSMLRGTAHPGLRGLSVSTGFSQIHCVCQHSSSPQQIKLFYYQRFMMPLSCL